MTDNEAILNDLNSLPPPTSNVNKYTWEKVISTTIFPVRDQTPICFEIGARNDVFTDVKNIQQVLSVKIRKKTDAGALANLTAADSLTVVPYNAFLYTCMGEVQLDVQHKPLFKAYDNDILNYIKLLYSASNDAKNSVLQNALWWQDADGSHSVVQQDQDAAPGEYRRNRRITQSALLQLQGRVLIDPLEVARPYPENVSLSLKFFPNIPSKCLVQTGNLNLVLEVVDMYLLVPRIYPKQSLLKQPVQLPYISSEVIRMMVPANQRNFGPRTIKVAEHLPRRAYVFIWSENQLNGSYTQNRLELNHFNIKQCLLQCNSTHLPYWDGWVTDFAAGKYSELYDGIFKQLELDPSTVSVNRRSFPQGFVVFPFDISGKAVSSDYYPGKQSGVLELTIEFGQANANNLAVMVVLENERILSFNKNREFTDNPPAK